MKLHVLILCCLIALVARTNAQAFTIQEKIRTIKGDFVAFSVDNLGNIYLMSPSNQLKKLGPTGDSIAVFNQVKRFGEAFLADVTNPLQILLFYKNFSTVAMLDGLLNVKSTLDFRQRNIFRVSAVSLSYDGRLWVFDETENCLKKINDNGELIFKTPDFRQLFSESPLPQKIFDQHQLVYVCDPAQGIFVFDHYGAFRKRIDFRMWKNLWIDGAIIMGNDSSQFISYDPRNLSFDRSPIPPSLTQAREFLTRGKYLYALTSQGVDVYNISR